MKTFPQIQLKINEKKVNYTNLSSVDDYRHNTSIYIGKSFAFAVYFLLFLLKIVVDISSSWKLIQHLLGKSDFLEEKTVTQKVGESPGSPPPLPLSRSF